MPLPDIVYLRHMLEAIQIDVVWDTATVDAPGLRELVEAAVRSEEDPDG